MVRSGVGGVILYGGPAPADVAAQLHALHVAAGSWRLVVATDEEGGDIQRLRGVTGGLAWARQQAAQGPAAVQAGALRVGRRLAAVGVDVDLAPVADLDAGPGPDAQHPDGQRSFSASPSVAGADVVAFAQGLQQAGVLAVVKHFPGLGTASGNTDVSTASTAPFGTFAGRDLLPFGAAVAAGAGGVMMANAVVPGLSTQPVVLSSAATTTLLRGQLGFHGVVFTDSLSAGAIAQAGLSVPQAAVAALGAGADDVLFGTATTVDPAPMAGQIRAAIVSAVRAGTLPEARVRDAATRIARSLGSPVC
jgi:beta-N-acetylhexosaminidase